MDETFETIDDAVEAFMKSSPSFVEEEEGKGADGGSQEEHEVEVVKPHLEGEPEEEEEDDEDTEEGEDDLGEDDEEGDEDNPSIAASDSAEVTVTVDGKDHKVKVADLKRLYGQEAALTQKSQAVSTTLRAIENQGLYLSQVLDARVKAAEANHTKYANIDLFKAYRELDSDEFEALKSAKEAAEAEYRQVNDEAQTFLQRTEQTRRTYLRERAKTSLVEIKRAIPDWNDKVYEEVRGYAVAQGMDADTVNEVVDHSAIIMMHKAMLYDKAKAGKNKVTQKVAKAPTKVVAKSDTATDTTSTKLKRIRANALESGDINDVAELMLLKSKSK